MDRHAGTTDAVVAVTISDEVAGRTVWVRLPFANVAHGWSVQKLCDTKFPASYMVAKPTAGRASIRFRITSVWLETIPVCHKSVPAGRYSGCPF